MANAPFKRKEFNLDTDINGAGIEWLNGNNKWIDISKHINISFGSGIDRYRVKRSKPQRFI